MRSRKRLVLILVVAVVVGILLLGFGPSSSAPEGPVAPAVGGIVMPEGTLSPVQKQPVPKGAGGTSGQPAMAQMTVLSPISGDTWVHGKIHNIRWSRAAGFSTGSIYLVNASTGAIAGWITPNVGPLQTSFDWNTREVFLSRTNPIKKDIPTGSYIVKVKFDGPLPEIQSGAFKVIYQSEVQIPTHQIAIRNFMFNPSSLTAEKGDKIQFINYDSVTHRVLLNLTHYTVEPGASFTFDTLNLAAGYPYSFYSDAYSSMKLVVTLKNRTE